MCMYKGYKKLKPIEKFNVTISHMKLKADWPHPHDYSKMPTDYRHINKHLGLVKTLLCSKHTVIALCCTWQSRAPNIDHCAPENWCCPVNLTNDLDPDFFNLDPTLTFTLKQGNSDVKMILALDLELWPTTLTCNPRPAKVKFDPHA